MSPLLAQPAGSVWRPPNLRADGVVDGHVQRPAGQALQVNARCSGASGIECMTFLLVPLRGGQYPPAASIGLLKRGFRRARFRNDFAREGNDFQLELAVFRWNACRVERSRDAGGDRRALWTPYSYANATRRSVRSKQGQKRRSRSTRCEVCFSLESGYHSASHVRQLCASRSRGFPSSMLSRQPIPEFCAAALVNFDGIDDAAHLFARPALLVLARAGTDDEDQIATRNNP